MPATDDTSGTMLAVQTELEPRSRRFRHGLLLITAIGAVWRLGVLFVDKWRQPLLLNDSLYYSAQAQQLADGTWFREIFVDRPGAEHGPLTSLLLAPVSWVDDPVPWQRLVTASFGIVTIAVIGVLARRMAGGLSSVDPNTVDRVGWAAAAIATVSPNLWMNDGLVMSESLSVLMVCLTLLAALRALESNDLRSVVVVGVVAGLAALARSELALLTPAVIVLVFVSAMRDREPETGRSWLPALRRPAVVGLASLAAVAPWVVFNLARFDETVTLTTNDGTTLLGSYCDASFSGPNIGGWSLLCVVADPDYAMDEEPSVRSARQRDLAIDYATHHLDELPKVIAARIGRTFDLYGLDSLIAQDVGEERYRWASWAGIVVWWVSAVLAIRGAVSLRRASGGERLRRLEWWLLLCPVASVMLTTVVFYGGHRIRSSMEPTVIVLAAVAVAEGWAFVERRRSASTADRSSSSSES